MKLTQLALISQAVILLSDTTCDMESENGHLRSTVKRKKIVNKRLTTV